jgi:hypothetical protein
MSDTPETDEAQFGTGRVSVDFARRLERERDEARDALSGRTVSCSQCNQVAVERDEAREAYEHERNVRKNLQHVIISQWGVDMITNSINLLREIEKGIGPLGPINDFALAQHLSSTIVLPAKLKVEEAQDMARELRDALYAVYNLPPNCPCAIGNDEMGVWHDVGMVLGKAQITLPEK